MRLKGNIPCQLCDGGLRGVGHHQRTRGRIQAAGCEDVDLEVLASAFAPMAHQRSSGLVARERHAVALPAADAHLRVARAQELPKDGDGHRAVGGAVEEPCALGATAFQFGDDRGTVGLDGNEAQGGVER